MTLPSLWSKPFQRILILFLFLIPICLNAQEVRKSANYQDEFRSFKNNIGLEFDSFVQHNDSVFLQFLSESWKELLGVPNKVPIIPKPIRQPKIVTPLAPESPIKADTTKFLPIPEKGELIPEKKDSVPPTTESFFSDAMSSFNFYGTEISIPVPDSRLPFLNSVSKEGVINFFATAANYALLSTVIKKVKENAIRCRLNDWGLTSMLMSSSKKLYQSRNEQVLFTWYALIRNGINAKVGFNKERVFLLLPTAEKVYSICYTINNIPYYLFDVELNTSQADLLTIYEADYPGNRNNFSFLITETPQLGNQTITKVIDSDNPLKLTINKDLVDFYRNYPTCDLKMFFAAPLSESMFSQLDLFFRPLLKNKNDNEIVSFLLDFVQYGIKYQTDQEQFGREKYLFPDETLYYPASDCEDRAILLSKLIQHYTSFDTIGLLYPEHVSLAVNLNDMEDWKYFTFQNKRFYNCDPTYLGASCGTIMPKLVNRQPEIID